MQSKTFSRISAAIVIVVSLYILITIGQRAASVAPFPATATTTQDLATTTSVSTTTTPVSTTTSLVSATPPALLDGEMARTDIRVPSGTIHALVAATEAEQSLGLGERASLPKDSGMLFVFQEVGAYGFWMKDMRFPIDIIWIGEGKVVDVTHDATVPTPGRELATYSPSDPADAVLEINAGVAGADGIVPGAGVEIRVGK